MCISPPFGYLCLTESCSQYIFANMFTGTTVFLSLVYPSTQICNVGVVVENFSYVFQASGSGTRSISREQMRSFKKVWAQCSNPKTKYLERSRFAEFFSVSLHELFF